MKIIKDLQPMDKIYINDKWKLLPKSIPFVYIHVYIEKIGFDIVEYSYSKTLWTIHHVNTRHDYRGTVIDWSRFPFILKIDNSDHGHIMGYLRCAP